MLETYEFQLIFALPDPDSDPDNYVDALFEAGCDDTLIGIGQPGTIGLDLLREAPSAAIAVMSAILDVKRAIPGAKLEEVKPDGGPD